MHKILTWEWHCGAQPQIGPFLTIVAMPTSGKKQGSFEGAATVPGCYSEDNGAGLVMTQTETPETFSMTRHGQKAGL